MIKTIQQLKEKMIWTRIARGNNFVGCTEEEIIYIENKYGGVFPSSYRDIISLIGYDAGYAFDDSQCGFFIDQMIDEIDSLKQCMEEDRTEGWELEPLPNNFWPIYQVYGATGEINFIYLNSGVDCPVYRYFYGDNTSIEIVWDSVWSWIAAIIPGYYRSYYRGRQSKYKRIKTEEVNNQDGDWYLCNY
jgi:SMI1 / KNR4 family (SUKH-1)